MCWGLLLLWKAELEALLMTCTRTGPVCQALVDQHILCMGAMHAAPTTRKTMYNIPYEDMHAPTFGECYAFSWEGRLLTSIFSCWKQRFTNQDAAENA